MQGKKRNGGAARQVARDKWQKTGPDQHSGESPHSAGGLLLQKQGDR